MKATQACPDYEKAAALKKYQEEQARKENKAKREGDVYLAEIEKARQLREGSERQAK